MTPAQIQKINRFTERLPEHLHDHWREILEILRDEDPTMTLLMAKIEESARMLRVMQLWIREDKLNRVSQPTT